MHPTGMQTVEEWRRQALRLHAFIWCGVGVGFLVIAIVLARYAPSGWDMMSMPVGMLAVFAAMQGSYTYGRSEPR